MKTTSETFQDAQKDLIAKIEAMPNTMTVWRDWEETEVDVTEAKREAIAGIQNKDTFIPAFTPLRNAASVYGLSQLANDVITAATWEGEAMKREP